MSVISLSLMAAPPPGGGGGGGTQEQITDLDERVSVIESQDLDNRINTAQLAAESAFVHADIVAEDVRIIAHDALAVAGDASTRITNLENQDLDNRITTAQSVADEAHLVAVDARAQVTVLGGENLPTRVSAIESLNLESRLSDLESLSQPNRVITVSAHGASPADNGLALIDAVNMITSSHPAPSATEPYLILIYPGNYDLGSSILNLSSFVSLKGFDKSNTVIYSTVRVANVSNSSVESLTLRSPLDTGSSAVNVSTIARFKDVHIEGRWGVSGAGASSVELIHSTIKAHFKCFERVSNITMDDSECEGSTFFDTRGGDIKVSNSVIGGNWVVFDGPSTNIEIRNSKVTGSITPTNVNPSPTQNITIAITNSDINTLKVGFPSLTVDLLFSRVSSLEQTDGNLFMSHSIIGSLNAPTGTGNYVNSQLGSPNITGGSITCPFSYDENYQLLSGVSC